MCFLGKDWQMAGPVKKHAYLDLDMEVPFVCLAFGYHHRSLGDPSTVDP